MLSKLVVSLVCVSLACLVVVTGEEEPAGDISTANDTDTDTDSVLSNLIYQTNSLFSYISSLNNSTDTDTDIADSSTSSDNQITPRSDVVVGFGTVASTVLIGAGNILSLLLGFLYRKKLEVLVMLAAILGPFLYLKGPHDPAQMDPTSAIHDLGVAVPGHDSDDMSHFSHHEKEGRFFGSLLSSLYSALGSIFQWPVHFVSSLLGYGGVPLVSSDSVSQVHGEGHLPENMKVVETHSELEQIIKSAISQHQAQYDEEVNRIKATLQDHSVNIEPPVLASIEDKYGAGTWSYTITSLTDHSALVTSSSPPLSPSAQADTFKHSLETAVGEPVTQVNNIKGDVWSSVQQYDAVQKLVMQAKISELYKSAEGREGKEALNTDKVVLTSNLQLEVGNFLQDSLLHNNKESAVWKLALLWNLALQLNELQSDIVKLGVTSVLDSSQTSKQLLEASLAQKSSEIGNHLLSLSFIALEVEEVKTNELAAVNAKVSDGSVLILNTISAITQSGQHTKETVDLNTVTQINEKVKIISDIPVPFGVGDVVKDVISEFMNTKKADVEGIKMILFLSPVIIESAKSELIDAKFGAGTWSAILSSLFKGPAKRTDLVLSPEAELFKEILSSSIGSTLDQLAGVADDLWDLLKQLDDLQNEIVDDKLFSLIDSINNKLSLNVNLIKIPGEIGGAISANLAEVFGKFLVESGLDLKSQKSSLFDFALKLNEMKLQVVDSGVTGALSQTSNLENLNENMKDDAINSIKESLTPKQTKLENLISSLFDLTVTLDDSKRNKVSLDLSAGLHPFMDHISTLLDFGNGISAGESLDHLTLTINNLLKGSSVVSNKVVEDLIKTINTSGGSLGEIETLEKEVEQHSHQTFQELLKVHTHQDD